MAKKQLKIKLLPNGEIQMQTIGIKGKKCVDYIKTMKALADIKIEKQEFTNEYYEEDQYSVNNAEQNINIDY